ncbi:MAG: hypothetical protein ACNA7Y_00275 [Gammaproteobacteria bacterium]
MTTKVFLGLILTAGIVSFNPAFAKSNINWLLSENALGPIQVGMTVAEAEKASQKKFVLNPLTPPIETEACRFATLENGPKKVFFMLNDGIIVRIDIKNPAIKTTGGFHLGSNAQDIKKQYKGKIEAYPNKYEEDKDTLVVTPDPTTNNRFVFDTDGEKILYIRAGRTPQVEYVEGCS